MRTSPFDPDDVVAIETLSDVSPRCARIQQLFLLRLRMREIGMKPLYQRTGYNSSDFSRYFLKTMDI